MPKVIDRVYIDVVVDEDPDTSWLDQTDAQMGEGFEAQSAERKQKIADGDVWFVGVRVACDYTLRTPYETKTSAYIETTRTISSPGVWGIESDSGEEYFRVVAADELPTFRDMLREDGFDDAAFLAQVGSSWDDPQLAVGDMEIEYR